VDMSNRHVSILLSSAKAPSVTVPNFLDPPGSVLCMARRISARQAVLVGWHAFLQGSDPSHGREITAPVLGSYQSVPSHNVYHCRYAWQGAP
jgi:hypothetical protein